MDNSIGKHSKDTHIWTIDVYLISYLSMFLYRCVTITEFQLRGLPHWHILVWVKLPWDRDGIESNPEYLEYCSQFISTDTDLLLNGGEQQTHKCSERCLKDDKCKYRFPHIPMPK